MWQLDSSAPSFLHSSSLSHHSTMGNESDTGVPFLSLPQSTNKAVTRVPASGVVENIPIIDISGALQPNPDESVLAEIVAAIGKACVEWGFFQVVNHGVPEETVNRLKSESKKFFSLPLEEKRKVRRDVENPQGFYESEVTKNVKDWKEVFDYSAVEPLIIPKTPDPEDPEIRELSNRWPENPPCFKKACQDYADEMVKLGLKLMELICLSLNLPKDRLRDYFKDTTSYMRMNYYSPCTSSDPTIQGAGPHKDYGAISIVAHDDVPGLEVYQKETGEWNLVVSEPGALIINVGDVMQVWSNDTYYSVDHRAKTNKEKERQSWGFFFAPSHYVVVKPLEELLIGPDGEPKKPKYRGYNYGKFYAHRKLTNFKKLMENIQIDHFKI